VGYNYPSRKAGGDILGNSDDAGTVLWVVLVLVAVSGGIWGIYEFATADYFNNPIQAFQQQTTGLLAMGLFWTLLLVLLGAASVVGAVLSFISDRGKGL
jgi:hypothetical protein